MTPTDEQTDIVQTVKSASSNILINALAGTGKTTTLRMIGDALPGRGQYTAFNAALVSESKEKFQGTKVACNTTHSLALRAVGKDFAHRLGGNRVKRCRVVS